VPWSRDGRAGFGSCARSAASGFGCLCNDSVVLCALPACVALLVPSTAPDWRAFSGHRRGHPLASARVVPGDLPESPATAALLVVVFVPWGVGLTEVSLAASTASVSSLRGSFAPFVFTSAFVPWLQARATALDGLPGASLAGSKCL